MRYFYMQILQLCTSIFNFENIDKGLITENNPVLVWQKDLNGEILHLTIKYPFQPAIFNKTTNSKSSKCSKLLENYTEEKIQNSINLYFEEGRKFLEQPHRQRRQALLISGVAGILGYFTHSLVDSFTGITHTIGTEKYMENQIQNLLCSDLSLQHKLLEIREELRGDEIVNLYFKTIEYDINEFNKGKIQRTQAQEIFREICQTLNEAKVCNYLIEFGTKNIELIGNGFIQNDIYQIQIRLFIPRLTGFEGELIKLHKVPLPSTKWFKNIILDTAAVRYHNRTIASKHCTGNRKIQICDYTQEISRLDFPELWAHDTMYVESMCIPTVFQDFIVLSAKVPGYIQFLSPDIDTKQLNKGIHVYDRLNKTDILITCNNEAYKILYSRFQNKTFSKIVDTKHINLTANTDIDSNQVIGFSDHSHQSTTVILMVSITINATVIICIWCLVKRRKIINFSMERTSVNSIKI